MPPAVGSGIRYTTVGGVVGAGCIPLPVPETYPNPYKFALVGTVCHLRSDQTGIDIISTISDLYGYSRRSGEWINAATAFSFFLFSRFAT